MPSNVLAWRIWNITNARDRQITMAGAGPISSLAILAMCELYDASIEDFEKVIKLDNLLYKGPDGAKDEEGLERVIKRAVTGVVKQKPKGIKPARKRKK